MKIMFKIISQIVFVLFSPVIYIYRKLPFSMRRKIVSNSKGFFGFGGKFVVVMRHLFSFEGSSKSGAGTGLLYIILSIFGGFVIWAFTAKFDQVITAEGKVFPFSRLQEIEHYEGGLLDKIHVKRGEVVTRNQLLVSLSPLSADSDFNIQKANIALLLIKKARLEAEYLGKKNFEISNEIKDKYYRFTTMNMLFF